MPTTFSTALPAMATTTSPAKASLMCSTPSAGVRAATNQSDTKAAPTLAAERTTTTAPSGQGPGWRASSAPRRPWTVWTMNKA